MTPYQLQCGWSTSVRQTASPLVFFAIRLPLTIGLLLLAPCIARYIGRANANAVPPDPGTVQPLTLNPQRVAKPVRRAASARGSFTARLPSDAVELCHMCGAVQLKIPSVVHTWWLSFALLICVPGFYPQNCPRYHRFTVKAPGNITFDSCASMMAVGIALYRRTANITESEPRMCVHIAQRSVSPNWVFFFHGGVGFISFYVRPTGRSFFRRNELNWFRRTRAR